MTDNAKVPCPECVGDMKTADGLDRRKFMGAVGGAAAALVVGGTATAAQTSPVPAAARGAKPAEAMIRELFTSLSADQKQRVVYPWNHGATTTQLPSRQRMYNSAFGRTISQVYTQPQQELVQRILRSICADDENYRRITTVLETDNWNRSGFGGAGATIFGDPTQGQYAWLFTAHHLTLRCDGDSQPDAAFGGPMYYGHLVDGYSARNAFNFQTRAVVSVYDALSEEQRRRAVLTGSPGELYESVRHRDRTSFPGLAIADLSGDQRRLVTEVMRTVLSPYRKEDVDEVMQILWRNGGLKRTSIAFYGDRNATDNRRWHFWRLEGPGFVWNYRVLPHVHCFVNIAARA